MFLIENKSKEIELFVLKTKLRALQDYLPQDIDYFDEGSLYPTRMNIKECIPVGSIAFVEACLRTVHGISHIVPLEVPEALRKPEFLMRQYNVVPGSKVPKTGFWHVKDVSRLKQMSFTGGVDALSDFGIKIFDDKTYVVSEVIDIMSEYRVIVLNDNIKAIQHYSGIPTIMPNEKGIDKIKHMVDVYAEENRPGAYAMDVAVLKNRELALIECCPFSCLATYGYADNDLPLMYEKGFKWIIENKGGIQLWN